MRLVASAKRVRPLLDRAYSLSLPARRPSSQPSCARRAVAVRTRRSLRPKGAASSIRLPKAMVPPRGMMESPNNVTMSEPPRKGRWRRNRATSSAPAARMTGAARPLGVAGVAGVVGVAGFVGVMRAFLAICGAFPRCRIYDTEFFAFLYFLYHNYLI